MSIYSIYKKTAIWILTVCVLLAVGVCEYIIYISPNISHNKGVTEAAPGSVLAGELSGIDTDEILEEENAEVVSTQQEMTVQTDSFILSFSNANSSSGYLWIPVEDTVKASNVVIENHYMERQLWVSVSGSDLEFYRHNYISGNLEGVTYGEATSNETTPEDKRVILKFTLDHVYEYNTIFEDNVLYVEKVSPRELYDKIVVIDPDGEVPDNLLVENSLTPSRICLDIASKVKDELEADGVHVYVTSLDERDISDEDRVLLCSEVKPDMLIRVETAYDEDSKVYGTKTVYNGTYFIPRFGSVELADLLEAHVTTSIGGLAGGLMDATEDDVVIKKATIPAAAVRVGYYTNAQENILLNREDYRTKIAQGISDAVLEAFGEE